MTYSINLKSVGGRRQTKNMMLFIALSSALPERAMTTELTHGQTLTTLLTVESLIFAALSVGITVTTPVAGGRSPYLATGRLARRIALTLTAVAFAAGLAWWQVFTEPAFPRGFFRWAEAVGVVVAIMAQPYFAWRLALGAKK
jgi:hypothetical protein